MKVRMHPVAVLAALIATLVAVLAVTAGSGTASSQQTPLTAALISDVGRFNDKAFNQSQLAGLNRAKRVLKVKTLPLQSNSDADYIPNLTTALRRGSGAIHELTRRTASPTTVRAGTISAISVSLRARIP